MLVRTLIATCFLLLGQYSFAEWQVVTTNMDSRPALLQKDVSANEGTPLVAIICIPEPTLIVEWTGPQTDLAVSIDTVQIDIPRQTALRNGNQAVTLKPGHIQGLIKGWKLQLTATLPSGESITAETSLWGFDSQFKKAKMDCSL